jgi:hypothetical protein
MSTRLRSLLAALAVITAIAVTLVPTGASGARGVETAVEAMAPSRAHRVTLSTPELRDWRTAAAVAGGGASLSLITAVVLVLAGIVGRSLRRIGDIGDDWRSLLEGAPPALP